MLENGTFSLNVLLHVNVAHIVKFSPQNLFARQLQVLLGSRLESIPICAILVDDDLHRLACLCLRRLLQQLEDVPHQQVDESIDVLSLIWSFPIL